MRRVIGPYGQLAPLVEPVLVTCRLDTVNQIGRLRITRTLGYGQTVSLEEHEMEKAIGQEQEWALTMCAVIPKHSTLS